MKNTLNQEAYKAIQQIFQSGEVSRIVFLKSGKVSVKYHTEPNVVYYKEGDKTLDIVSGELEIRKSLERVENKPKVKITVTEVETLNSIHAEINIGDFWKEFKESNTVKPKSLFNKVSTFLWGEKSFRWGELKGL